MYFQLLERFITAQQKFLSGTVACIALSCCQVDDQKVTDPVPISNKLSGLTVDQVPDGRQCNSNLPIGDIFDRRNNLIMWKVGAFDTKTAGEIPAFLYAVGKKAEVCRFYFVSVDQDTEFTEPIISSPDWDHDLPFAKLVIEMIDQQALACIATKNKTTFDPEYELCRSRAVRRVLQSVSQVDSSRPEGDRAYVKFYLFVGDDIFNEEGSKL
jgi:hypothetical protein